MNGLLEATGNFALLVSFAVSAACIFWYLTTSVDDARGLPAKGRLVYRAGRAFVWLYGAIAVTMIGKEVAAHLEESVYGMAIVASVVVALVYILRGVKHGR